MQRLASATSSAVASTLLFTASICIVNGSALSTVSYAAQPTPIMDGVAQLKQFIETTHAAQGQFTQRNGARGNSSGSVANKAQITTGVFAWQQPNRFVWHIQQPYAQKIVSDGKNVSFYDQDLDERTIKPVTEGLNNAPLAAIFSKSSWSLLNQQYEIRSIHSPQPPSQPAQDAAKPTPLQWVQLTPKRSDDQQFQTIQIGFRANTLEQLWLTDQFKQTSQITFTTLMLNPKLNAALFQLD